jgi:hypothetical protein
MAKWTGLKASSAATLYRGAKRKLNKYMDGTTTSSTSTTSPAKAGPAPKRAKKSTAKTAKGVAKEEEEESVKYPAAIIKKEPIYDSNDSNDENSDLRASQVAVEISTLAAQAVCDASDATTASTKEE